MAIPPEDWTRYKESVLAAVGDFSRFYSDLEMQRPSVGTWISARCPFHDDKHPSFAFDKETGGWICFAGCGSGSIFDFLMKISGRDFREELLAMGDEFGVPRPHADLAVSTVYDYCSESGELRFQVVRNPDKNFRQRRPGDNGDWIWNLEGVERVLYRLPDLTSNPDEIVYVCEGEKDADRLASMGLVATTNPGGAGKWRPPFSEYLRGRDAAVLPDNDEAGRNHAARVASMLRGIARSVKIVELPGLPEKGDVSDWLNAGRSREDLLQVVGNAPAWPSEADVHPDDEFPEIETNGRQLRDVIDDTWRALLAMNDPPRLFRFSGALAQLRDSESGPQTQLLEEADAFGLLIRSADWVKKTRDGSVAASPSKDVAKDILANPHPSLPKLEEVVSSPVFDQGGKLLGRPGYHRSAKLWLHISTEAETYDVPSNPSEDDVEDALDLLRQDLLVDFPFAAESDSAHALAALLLPFVRRMIDGPTPIHLIEAPTPGTGKSLLADLVSIVSLGRPCESTTVTRNEDESRKKLTAILARGRPVVVIDNVQGGLESAQLASAVTAEVWSDRLLGKTQMVEFPNRAVWLITANNPKISMEIARRCIRVRLEPAEERPWERTGFKHDDIRRWALRHRHELVRAVLVLVQSWVAAGMQRSDKTLGSFESWAEVTGGILHHVGVRDFLEDADDFYAEADSESGEWGAFVRAWWDEHNSAPVAPADLMTLAEGLKLVPFAYAASSEQARRAKFGKALSGLRDRKFGDLKVVVSKNKSRGSNDYRLVPAEKRLFPTEGAS